jgi:ABC-type transporter Mla subunit MlaD
MNKNPPSTGRIAAMVLFTLSVFALLLFLWVSFGGVLPLKAQGYRFQADFPEAALLAKEADVRIAGVNVGKVRSTELGPGGHSTRAEIEIDDRFAPIKSDTRAILRQKSLLGETYVELTPGQQEPPGRRRAARRKRAGHRRARRGVQGLRPAHAPLLPGMAA